MMGRVDLPVVLVSERFVNFAGRVSWKVRDDWEFIIFCIHINEFWKTLQGQKSVALT